MHDNDSKQPSAREVLLRPRDPIIARDGRPFAATPGAQAISLPWPLPSTTAGALRTQIGNSLAFDWLKDGPDRARGIAVHGPLMLARWPDDARWQIYVTAPRDALIVDAAATDAATRDHRMSALRPYDADELPDGAGCDLPVGLRPLRIPGVGKPASGYTYWPLAACERWLAAPAPAEQAPPARTLNALPLDARMHVKIDPQTRAAAQGYLFGTVGLAFADAPHAANNHSREESPARALLCRVSGQEVGSWTQAESAFVTLGGERRLAALGSGDGLWPGRPHQGLRDALRGARRLRLLLVTPALFTGGWRPGWLDNNLEGSPPGLPEARLRLVAAAVGRQAPVSGWNMQRHKGEDGRWRERGPKAARYTVPAGSVYFFDVVAGSLDDRGIETLWMAALSDEPQDRADGFGLSLSGVW